MVTQQVNPRSDLGGDLGGLECAGLRHGEKGLGRPRIGPLAEGRPDIDANLFLPAEVENFLEAIWRRFGHISTDKIIKMTKGTSAYKKAERRGHRAEIYLNEMHVSFIQAEKTPGIDQVIRPKLYRTQSGKNVMVQKWVPGNKPANGSPK